MKIIPSPNFFKGHRKRIAIVLHVSTSTMRSMDSWFSSKKSAVSAHYGIDDAGDVHQYVSETNSAWAVGGVKKPTWKLLPKANPNYYTISIEFTGNKDDVWSKAKKDAGVKLIRAIAKRYNIPLNREHIIGHYEIDIYKPDIGDKVDNMVSLLQSDNKVKLYKTLILLIAKLIKLLRLKLYENNK